MSTLNKKENVKILPTWKKFVDKIECHFDIEAEFCFMICGGTSTGKSTFVKYFLHRMLSFKNVDVVGCIDLDPGQPNFSLPGNLSLCTFSSVENKKQNSNLTVKSRNEMLFDSLSPVLSIIKYYKITNVLRETSKCLVNVPIIVNTMGHTFNAGRTIITDLIRIINPSHVVTLLSNNLNLNFEMSLSSEVINKEPKGYSESASTIVDYETVDICSSERFAVSRNKRNDRELKIISYIKTFFNPENNKCLRKANSTKLCFSDFAIHNARGDVATPYHLLAIYMQLVALCKVDEQFFIGNGTNRPKSLALDSSWLPSCKFLGYGIVVNICMEKKEVLIITPLNKEDSNLINTVVLSAVKIPLQFTEELLESDAPLKERDSIIFPNISHLPWFTWDEFELVKKWSFGGNVIEMQKASQYILIWQSRLPKTEDTALGATRLLLLALLAAENNNLERKLDIIRECVAKFVTLTYYTNDKRWMQFTELTGKEYPVIPIKIRNDIVRSEINISNERCQEVLLIEMELIKTYYWQRKHKSLENFYSMQEIKSRKEIDDSLGKRNMKKKNKKGTGIGDHALDKRIQPTFLEQLIFSTNTSLKKKRKGNKMVNKKLKKSKIL